MSRQNFCPRVVLPLASLSAQVSKSHCGQAWPSQWQVTSYLAIPFNKVSPYGWQSYSCYFRSGWNYVIDKLNLLLWQKNTKKVLWSCDLKEQGDRTFWGLSCILVRLWRSFLASPAQTHLPRAETKVKDACVKMMPLCSLAEPDCESLAPRD